MTTVGERIRATRIKKVMTQEQLAKAAHVQPVTISRIENGKNETMPRQSTIQRIAAALDVSASWLMFGGEEECGR